MVKVYTKPGCMQCSMTAQLLSQRGIKFDYVDISKDADAAARVQSLGYRQLPVVEVGDEHWSGFRPDRVNAVAAAVEIAA